MKKILIYLYYPFVSQKLSGGVQVSMRNIIRNLAAQGFIFRILCPKIENNQEIPKIKNVEVLPILNDFQNNRNITELNENFNMINCNIEWADIIWTIDRSIPVKTDKTIVLSLNSVCYASNQNSLFSMNWDNIITPSNYTKEIVEKIIKPNNWHGDKLPKIINIPPIPNYEFSHQSDISCLNKYFKINPNKKYILFPHRPDKGKGHKKAIDVLKALLSFDDKYILLIPKYATDSNTLKNSENEIIKDTIEYANKIGVQNNLILHDWINFEDLPAYYSLGYITIEPSELDETFGITLIDSILCGCPVISSGSGALKYTIPDNYGHRIINFDNPIDVAIQINSGITGIDQGIKFIQQNYSFNSIISKYKELFLSAQKTNGIYYE